MQILDNDVTTSIILDKRRKSVDEKYPVKLRVTYDRNSRMYGTKCMLTEDEFESVTKKNPRGELKEIKIKLSFIEEKALSIIKEMDDFSFDKFKVAFGRNPRDTRNVFYYYETKINELFKNDQVGTATVYSDGVKSIKKFLGKETFVEFKEITPKKLEEYEKWMIKRGNSSSTIGMYARGLRTIFNIAKREGIISESLYPFGTGKYSIPVSRNIKKALTIQDIGKLYNFKLDEFSYADKSRDLWFFSYFCNGMNISDIARLKFKNVTSKSISFIRKKTSSNKKQIKPIVAPLTEESKRIIDKWSNKDKSPDNYVFPILTEDMTAEQEQQRIKWVVKQINKYMSNIAADIGIEQRITTYTARHSFSTVLKRSGVSTEFISESLGHSDLRTTELYLDSFEDDMKSEMARFLTDF